MSDYTARDLVALDHVEDLLEAYADARLAPSRPVLARMRANVMAQAATMAAIDAAARTVLESGESRPSRWSLPRFVLPRPAFALVGSLILVAGSSMAVLAAPPGSPFFNARVAIEAAFLPTQLDARLASHEEHLATRLAEAEAAAASGNAAALEAALAAYRAEVDAAVADVGIDADRLAHIEAMLAKHVAVLTALQAGVQGAVPEKAAIDKALESSQKAIEKVKAKGGHGGPPSDKPANPNPGRN